MGERAGGRRGELQVNKTHGDRHPANEREKERRPKIEKIKQQEEQEQG
jgi:hypothetical protein